MILDAVEICKNINGELALFIHNIIVIIKLGVPIVLVIMGMIDFGKAVVASKEDEMAKARKEFIKRVIAGAAVFLMITVTQLAIKVLDRNSSGTVWECANKIMNGGKSTETSNSKQNKTAEEQKRLDCCINAGGEKVLDREDWSCKLNNSEVSKETKKI